MSDQYKVQELLEKAKWAFEFGQRCPYDAPDDWLENEDCEEPAPSPIDWAHTAARAILADLTDRKRVKWAFQEVEEDVRQELVQTLAEIIREADRRRKDAPATLSDFLG